MRALWLVLPVVTLALAGCNGGGEEICDNQADDDGDGSADCADPACAADPICVPPPEETDCFDGADDDDDGDIDCDDSDCDDDCPDGPEDCTDEGQDDEDGDGDANCADSDCAGVVGCRLIYWGEFGEADVVPGTSYDGTMTFDYSFLDPADGGVICHYQFEATNAGVRNDCDGCDFAFDVAQDNGTGVDGDCAGLGLADGAGGYEYGYGFDADYSGYPDSLMYYFSGYGWYSMAPYYVTASFQGGQFEYEGLIWGYYYY